MLIHERLSNQSNMSDIEKNIADYFLENPQALRELSARKLAEKLFIATSTISRFCKKIGYIGYNDFKEAYLEENNYLQSHFIDINPNRPFEMNDSPWTIANKIHSLYEETISDTLSLLNHKKLEEAVKLLEVSNKIYIYSGGDTLDLAKNFKHKMMRIGKDIEVIDRTDLAYYHAHYVGLNDCFLLISYSGETNDILRILKVLGERNLPTIAITSYGENTLSNLANITLNMSTREKLINNLGSFSSDLSVMYLLDVLYGAYFSKDYVKHYKQKIQIAKNYQTFRNSTNPLLKD